MLEAVPVVSPVPPVFDAPLTLFAVLTLLELPEDELLVLLSPFIFLNLFIAFITKAPPAAAPIVETGDSDFIPNIDFINFSAGTKNAKHAIVYKKLVFAKLIAFVTNIVYINNISIKLNAYG